VSSAAEDGVSGGVASSLLTATSVAGDFKDRFHAINLFQACTPQ
jgi:hypothetical protein